MVQAIRFSVAFAVVYLVLIQPNHPAAMTPAALAVFPLELPVIWAALVLAGTAVVGRMLQGALTAVLIVVVLLKLADFATFAAFNRGFNVMVDLHLLPAAWGLATGSIGVVLATAAVGAALAGVLALSTALFWALGVLARLPAPRWAAAVVFVPSIAFAAAEIGQASRVWNLPPTLRAALPGAAFTARVAIERVGQVARTRADIAAFRAAAEVDPMRDAGPWFDALGARDLIMVYVESYGRSSFQNPLYRATHEGTLRRIETDLRGRGLAMRSGWLTAPMAGGQSWLAHGSVASGLWLDTQARYRAMLVSRRQTFLHFAQRSGRRTVAIKPAHVFPWPEGAFFGFDVIYNAADLGYKGLPFNWVTMPDQFTLAALDRLERAAPQGTRVPIVAQVALVSSHAPWVPIPPLLPWDALGDGSIFNTYALSGDPPEVVWRDHDRVRDQFRLAVDYSLQSVGAWAARHADDPPLMIVLGDHQPAGFVAGNDNRDVAIHVIGPPDLVARFGEMGWQPGMIPHEDLTPLPMDQMRDVLLRVLSTGAP